MSTPAQRRAAYKFYRDLGYTPAEARKMRNRTTQVIKDWAVEKRYRREEQRERDALRPRALRVPAGVVNKKMILKLRKDLVDMGMSKRAAYNMTRSKKKAVFNHYSVERMLESTGKPTRKAAKKAYKKMMKQWKQAQSTADIYKAMETAYMALVGVF